LKTSVAISHASFDPKRVDTLRTLLSRLGRPPEDPLLFVYKAKCSIRERSEAQWKFSVRTEADYCLMMDDDVIPVDGFWDHLTAAISAAPNEILTLYPVAPLCADLNASGVAFGLSQDGLLGRSWCMPHTMLKEFLAWRSDALIDGALEEDFPEDTQVNLFAMCTGRVVHTTLPGLVTCAPGMVSTFTEGEGQFTKTVAPMYDYSHGWATKENAGWTFYGQYWYLLTKLKPEYIRKNDLVRRAYELHRSYEKDTSSLLRNRKPAA
jgi:hypothetical protein